MKSVSYEYFGCDKCIKDRVHTGQLYPHSMGRARLPSRIAQRIRNSAYLTELSGNCKGCYRVTRNRAWVLVYFLKKLRVIPKAGKHEL